MGQLRKDIHDLSEKGKVGDWAFAEDAGKEFLLLRIPVEYDPAGEIAQLELCSGDGSGQAECYVWNGKKKSPTIEGLFKINGRGRGFYLQAGELKNA